VLQRQDLVLDEGVQPSEVRLDLSGEFEVHGCDEQMSRDTHETHMHRGLGKKTEMDTERASVRATLE
jgi:hypothetical protein